VQANWSEFQPPSDFRAGSDYRRASGLNLAYRVLEEATSVARWRGIVSSEGGM
jgi:xanthine dehydrogenase iron-sulfur cluster and FAD-binding subunit A